LRSSYSRYAAAFVRAVHLWGRREPRPRHRTCDATGYPAVAACAAPTAARPQHSCARSTCWSCARRDRDTHLRRDRLPRGRSLRSSYSRYAAASVRAVHLWGRREPRPRHRTCDATGYPAVAARAAPTAATPQHSCARSTCRSGASRDCDTAPATRPATPRSQLAQLLQPLRCGIR